MYKAEKRDMRLPKARVFPIDCQSHADTSPRIRETRKSQYGVARDPSFLSPENWAAAPFETRGLLELVASCRSLKGVAPSLFSFYAGRMDVEQIWMQIDVQIAPVLCKVGLTMEELDLFGEEVESTDKDVGKKSLISESLETNQKTSQHQEFQKLDSCDVSSMSYRDIPKEDRSSHVNGKCVENSKGRNFFSLHDMTNFVLDAESQEKDDDKMLVSEQHVPMDESEHAPDSLIFLSEQVRHVAELKRVSVSRVDNDIMYEDLFLHENKAYVSSTRTFEGDDIKCGPIERVTDSKPVTDSFPKVAHSLNGINGENSTVHIAQKFVSKYDGDQEKLATRIIELEQECVQPDSWVLRGEARADNRQKGSALENEIEFDYLSAPKPVDDEALTARLDGLIKSRIMNQIFDDLNTMEKLEEGSSMYNSAQDLDDTKSRKGLGEVYANKFTTQTSAAQCKEFSLLAGSGRAVEARYLYKVVGEQLDKLGHYHFSGKQLLDSSGTAGQINAFLQLGGFTPVVHQNADGRGAKYNSRRQKEDRIKANMHGHIKTRDELETGEKSATRNKLKRKHRARMQEEEHTAARFVRKTDTSKSSMYTNNIRGTLRKVGETLSDYSKSSKVFLSLQEKKDVCAS
ncbi:U3 small nucleolar ribonucleoprotein component [Micromonas pusilla CCMP1545]|jgi:U3 small nucleolar RNA-associated protein MPP10|uniref:U3 small nucleolar ribonucleoprotein component n=2 Tax=Micromonas pusilla TaxID=38833 RepID=C1MK72_MICPC|nr:U3 small nucleolar ribonucleoprotein component [Micromonas pusilla CCMP1545]EEH59708.1 U3 small nucleolar ribonucleoprotein component [Micromonas pusilla CCMP1545]|eukprot:XP_003056332.1 U3 small nucleolar ribonucleoprotein component [Micromonas pusilla CCMP1545]